MSSKFLTTTDTVNLTDGSVDAYFSSVGADSLDAGQPVKVSAQKILYSSNISVSEIDPADAELDMNSQKITNVLDPTSAQDAATKNYIDSKISNDVIGPVSAVDSNLCSFDGSTGKIIKDSGVLQSNVFLADGSVSMTSTVKATDGTAGLPAYTFASDQNAGMYTDTGDLLLAVAGSEIVRMGADVKLSSALNMNTSNKIINLADPTSAQDASTKAYSDTKLAIDGTAAMTGRLELANLGSGGLQIEDSSWGIYRAEDGAGNSFSGGTANAGVDGALTDFSLRLRVYDVNPTEGLIVENSAEEALLSIAGDTGNAHFVNDVTLGGDLNISNIVGVSEIQDTMTSNTTPSPNVTSASTFLVNPENFQPYRAFDKNVATIWHSAASVYNDSGVYIGSESTTITGPGAVSGEWLQIDFGTAKSITSYRMHPRSGLSERMPSEWYLAYSPDGVTWSQADYRVSITFADAYQSFTLPSVKLGRYWRIVCVVLGTSGTGRTTANIGELEYTFSSQIDIQTDILTVSGELDMGANNISTTGTVDGRDVSVDGSKLDSIIVGTQGTDSVAFGSGAVASGTSSVAIGLNAESGTGLETVSIGRDSGGNGNIGQRNVFIGAYAGAVMTSGDRNVVVGSSSADIHLGGDENTIIGCNGFTNQTSGTDNASLGYLCGDSSVTGSFCTLLGSRSDVADTKNYSVALGYEAKSDNSNELTIGSSTLANTVTVIRPGIDNQTDLGSASRQFKDIHLAGTISAAAIDTSSAATLQVGPATATKVEIADTGVTTEIQGPLELLSDFKFNKAMIEIYKDVTTAPSDTTTSATPFTIIALNFGTTILTAHSENMSSTTAGVITYSGNRRRVIHSAFNFSLSCDKKADIHLFAVSSNTTRYPTKTGSGGNPVFGAGVIPASVSEFTYDTNTAGNFIIMTSHFYWDADNGDTVTIYAVSDTATTTVTVAHANIFCTTMPNVIT